MRAWLIDLPVKPDVVRNEAVLRMFLLSALEANDAIGVLRRILDHVEAEARELRQLRAPHAGELPEGPDGFGHIAAEYGLRADEAIADGARWAISKFEHRPATHHEE